MVRLTKKSRAQTVTAKKKIVKKATKSITSAVRSKVVIKPARRLKGQKLVNRPKKVSKKTVTIAKVRLPTRKAPRKLSRLKKHSPQGKRRQRNLRKFSPRIRPLLKRAITALRLARRPALSAKGFHRRVNVRKRQFSRRP
jgi:hypothetical protein